jgi:sugar transferase (PEP-CTERM system associated)
VIRVFNQYVSIKSLLLMGIESAVIVLSLIAAARLRFWDDPVEFMLYTGGQSFLLQALTVLVVLEVCFYYNDLYDLASVRIRSEQLVRLVQAVGAGCILLGLLYYLVPGLLVGRGVLFIAVALAAGGVGLTRVGLDRVWRLTAQEKKILILGDGELAAAVAREIERRSDLNFRLTGFVSPTVGSSGKLFGLQFLGDATRLQSIVRKHNVARIVVALEDRRGTLPTRDLVHLRVQGTEVEDAHSVLAALTGRVWLRTVNPSWFVFSDGFHRASMTMLAKRVVDLAFGIIGLAISSPVILAVAVAVYLDSKGPVLYRQERVGLGGKVFTLLKFRSMRDGAEAENGAQWALEDDARTTRVGRFIRKYRLDELPQFINVIRGQMSFVGPRPERPVFVEELSERVPFYDERHSVRPGLTGWAQVEFQYGASIEDGYRKLEYDLFYLKNMSILFDITIVLRTAVIVLRGRGSR